MGTMYIGQQFLQNVLGYSTVGAGAAILPAALCMVLVAPRSANLVESRGRALHPLVRLRLRLGREELSEQLEHEPGVEAGTTT